MAISVSVSVFIIGSDNGLAPIRRQASIWTSDGLVYWYASLDLSEYASLDLSKFIRARQ